MLIRPSEEGYCAQGKDCFPVQCKPPIKTAWCQKHRLLLGSVDFQTRAFALVGIRKPGKRKIKAVLMDAITGSFYNPRTLLLASSLMRIEKLKRDQKAATTLLVQWVPAWGNEE